MMSMGVTVENSRGVIMFIVICCLHYYPQVYTKKAIYMALSAVLAKYLQKQSLNRLKNIIVI